MNDFSSHIKLSSPHTKLFSLPARNSGNAAHASVCNLRRSLALLLLLVCTLSASAQVIRITGRVLSREKGEPLIGVTVVDPSSDRLLATTDADGRFALNARANGSLRFSMVGTEPVTEKIKNRKYIEVRMDEKSTLLDEATVTAKSLKKEVIIEQTDIEIKGNTFYVRTRVQIPKSKFGHDTRLVVQPIINNHTRKEHQLMPPLVYDAQEYHRTQNRMYDYDMESQDPLAKYVLVQSDSTQTIENGKYIIPYNDSIYTEHVNDDFTCDIQWVIEDYTKLCFIDSCTIARGTINPLRLLDYSLEGKEITDESLFPKAQPQLREDRDDIKLHFSIGKSKLDLNEGNNQAEISKLSAKMKNIATDPNSELRAFTILGTASPDGRYASNLKLANARMESALGEILRYVRPSDRARMEVTSTARVAEWSEVVALLRRDSLVKEAEAMEAIIRQHGSIDAQSSAMKKLPFYTSLLLEKYLPQLRKVEYVLNYSVFRKLTVDEIRELYRSDYRQLSQDEYFRLYREETDEQKREEIILHALEVSPRFMLAANDLQVIKMNRKQPDPNLLAPFVGKNAPQEVNMNHIIALLDDGMYSDADTLTAYLASDSEDALLVKAISNALNGHYEEAYPFIEKTGPFNTTVLLLAMKRNNEAWQLAQTLDDAVAETHYVRAICLNRLEKPIDAYAELKRALTMKPELEQTARIDGDVNGLLNEKQQEE